MEKNRKRIAYVAIAILVVFALFMAYTMKSCHDDSTKITTPNSSASSSQGTKEPDNSTTKPGDTDNPPVDTKPDEKTGEVAQDPDNTNGPNTTTQKPDVGTTKPGDGNKQHEKPETGAEDPGTTITPDPITKGEPVDGADYFSPTGLKGIVGNKLFTVSLGSSNLVWVNPDEELSMNRSQYEAKFVETETKKEKIIGVTVVVSKKDPMEGIDYTIPTKLRGTSGEKLSTVSLKGTNLVWSNPNEFLSARKTQYKAEFPESDTKNGVTVMIEITVMTPSSGDDYGGGSSGGSTTNPPVDPNPPVNPDKPKPPVNDDDEGNSSTDVDKDHGSNESTDGDGKVPGTSTDDDEGDSSTDVDKDHGNNESTDGDGQVPGTSTDDDEGDSSTDVDKDHNNGESTDGDGQVPGVATATDDDDEGNDETTSEIVTDKGSGENPDV